MISLRFILRGVAIWAATVGIALGPLWAGECGCAPAEGPKPAKPSCCAAKAAKTPRCCGAKRAAAGRSECCHGAKVSGPCRCQQQSENPANSSTTSPTVRTTGAPHAVVATLTHVYPAAALADRSAELSLGGAIDHRLLASERCSILCKQQC
jgi:hypothetical protein